MSDERMANSVHQRLRNIRDQTGEQFNHLLMRYGLERMLYRLAASGHGDSFVLKGAMLFALWHDVPGRPTRDVDLLGFGTASHERMKAVFAEACNYDRIEDGLRFDPGTIRVDDIRDDQDYSGLRVRLLAFLGRARLAIQVDIGFGDALTPPPEMIDFPAILDFPPPRLRAYHPTTVVAEKLNAAVVLGALNSRMKDFYDMYIILTHMPIDEGMLEAAIRATFERRKVPIPQSLAVAFTEAFLEGGLKEIHWQAFLRRSALEDLALTLQDVQIGLRDRLWPILQRCVPQE